MDKPKLKNIFIKNMVEQGLANTTDHELSSAHAYKVFKFRDEVDRIYKELEDKRQKLVKQAGIEDGAKFEARREELTALPERNEEEQKELDELQAKMDRFGELYNAMLEEESELNVKTIPFDQYHILAKENKQTSFQIPTKEKDKNGNPKMRTMFIDFFTAYRSVLKNILWAEPEEEE